MRKLITAMAVSMAVIVSASAATPMKPVEAQVNIEAVVDSALIMADNYADAIAEKPEMAPPRLNVLRSYAGSKPAEARDSISSRLYAFFVNYTESEKAERAAAFRDCFLAVAPPDSPHLGPLYAAELQVAAENADTASLVRFIPMLDAYASRLGYDYDAELQAARTRLNSIRNRRPINEELIGVWVSDEMLEFPITASSYGFTVGKAFNVMGGNNYASAARDATEEDAIMTLNILGFGYSDSGAPMLLSFADKKRGFMALQKDECSRFGFSVDASRMDSKLHNRKPNWVYDAIQTVTDNNSRWLYGLWGTEQLRTNNPELSAAIRQSVQHTQALVAGHFSRSKYSFGDQLVANTIASGFSAITNGVIDHFSVSKEKIYSAEVNLQLQHQNKLVGRLDIINIEVRSDRLEPRVKERNAEVSYYRWNPEDNVFFLTSFETYVPLYAPSKAESERMKRIVKRAKTYWESRQSGKWFYTWFNEMMFSKLQNKAEEGFALTSEITDMLEI